MPLSIKSLECPVRDWFAATSTLGEHRVCVAAVAVRMAVLFPVAHTARELDQAAIALEVLRVPCLVHGSYTLLPYTVIGMVWYGACIPG